MDVSVASPGHPSVVPSASLLVAIVAFGLFSGCGNDDVTSPHDDGRVPASADTVVIDFAERHQRIRGFGGATVFRPTVPLSDRDLDRLFGNGEGQLGFTLHRMGKELWMTEHLDTLTTWEANLATGTEIHDAMAEASFSAYLWWYVKRFYGPLDEEGQVSKRGSIMAQYSKFVRPGYHRVEVSSKFYANDVHVSAYTGEKAVIVALNTGDTPVQLRFTLQHGNVSEMIPYRTTETTNLSQHDPLTVSDGGFTYTLVPESITTLVEN